MRLGIFARPSWPPAVNEKAIPVDQQSQADFWDAKAAAAEEQVRHVKDPLAMDSWLMIADSCRQLAGQFREMERQHSGKPSKL